MINGNKAYKNVENIKPKKNVENNDVGHSQQPVNRIVCLYSVYIRKHTISPLAFLLKKRTSNLETIFHNKTYFDESLQCMSTMLAQIFLHGGKQNEYEMQRAKNLKKYVPDIKIHNIIN